MKTEKLQGRDARREWPHPFSSQSCTSFRCISEATGACQHTELLLIQHCKKVILQFLQKQRSEKAQFATGLLNVLQELVWPINAPSIGQLPHSPLLMTKSPTVGISSNSQLKRWVLTVSNLHTSVLKCSRCKQDIDVPLLQRVSNLQDSLISKREK